MSETLLWTVFRIAVIAVAAVLVATLFMLYFDKARKAYRRAQERARADYDRRKTEDAQAFEAFKLVADGNLCVISLGDGAYRLPLVYVYTQRFHHDGDDSYRQYAVYIRTTMNYGGAYLHHQCDIAEQGILGRFRERYPDLEIVDVRRDDHDDYIVRTRRVVRG